eukprot:3326168-Heterocapsa_arctica.AAC.1
MTHHHDQSVIDFGFSGASYSNAVAAIVAHPQETPEAIELRKLLLRPEVTHVDDTPDSPLQSELGEAVDFSRRP